MRPIDADKLREEWVNHLHIPNPDSYFAVQQEISSEYVADFIQSIDAQPTVEPVMHGYWVKTIYGDFLCSNCHTVNCAEGNFCSWCGAKIRIDDDDTDS